MKKLFFISLLFFLLGICPISEALPVYSTNGFFCSKLGVTVTCKGPIPGGKDSVTATGHNLVYISMDVVQENYPTRYTYFSDTGCLVGYTFGAEGKVAGAVAVHRNSQKASFQIQNDNYDQVVAYCEQELPGSPKPVYDVQVPKMKGPTVAAPSAKPAGNVPSKSSTSAGSTQQKPAATPKSGAGFP